MTGAGKSLLAVVRADAGLELGSGHIRRSLALIAPLMEQGWCAGLAVNRAAVDSVPEIAAEKRFDLHVLEPADTDRAEREAAALSRRWPQGARLLVVDHYELGSAFERKARSFARCILAVDDLADRRHDVDALLDSAPGRNASDYGPLMDRAGRLLLGPAFAPVAPAFRAAREGALARRKTCNGRVSRILVSFGGTDPLGMTLRALQALADIEFDGAVEAVFGLPGKNAAAARARASRLPFRLEVTVGASDMAARMAQADLAVGAAGSSAFERCCVALPAVTIAVADNQAAIAKGLAKAGATYALGSPDTARVEELARAIAALLANPQQVTDMSARAAELVDGRGAERVLEAVLGPALVGQR